MEPTFTVVMPAYNSAATVGAAIRSVLAQTRGDFELLVVDDGSTDETAATVAQWTEDARVRLLRSSHVGPARARNVALAAARGRYVSMLDSDDLWLPTYLETMGAALDADPGAALAYTDAWVLDDATRRIQRVSAMHYQDPPVSAPRDPTAFLTLLVQRNFVYCGYTVRRAVLEQVDGYDPNCARAEDYDLSLRIVARGHRAIRVPGVLGVYRRRADSRSAHTLGTIIGVRDILRQVVARGDLPEPVRLLARARVHALDACLGRDGQTLRVSFRARLRLIELYRTLLGDWLWHRVTPGELAAVAPLWAAGPTSSAPDVSTAEALVRGGLWNVAGRVVPQLYSLLLSIAAVRWLGPDGMGRQSFIAFAELALIMLITGGLPLALMRYVGESLGRGRPGAVRGLFAWAWRLELLAAAVGAAVLVGAGLYGAAPRAAWLLAAVAAAAGILHTIPSALLIGAQRWRDATIAGLVTGAIATAATVGVLAAGGGIAGMFAVEASASIVGLIWTQRLARRALDQMPPAPAAADELRPQVLRYAALASLNVLLGFVVWRRSELFFLARYAGDADIARYSVAFALTAGLGMMFEAFAAVLTPAVATLHGAGERAAIATGYRRATRLVLVATLPATAVAIAVGPALLRLLYGNALASAGTVLLILLTTFPVVPLTRISSGLLHGHGRQRVLLLAGFGAAALNIGLAFLLVPRFAAAGAAVANCAGQLTAGLPVLFAASRVVGGLRLDWRRLAAMVAASVGAGVAGSIGVALLDGFLAVLVGVSAALLCFLALAVTMRVLTADDVDWLRAMVRSRLGGRAAWLERCVGADTSRTPIPPSEP